MTAKSYTITERQKERTLEVAHLSDFKLANATEIQPEQLITQPGWSLYTIEPEAAVAVFVRLPETAELNMAPFVYAAQYEQASQVATLPLKIFTAMGVDLPIPPSLSILFSTGRCGSTLASRILAKVPGVYSLSEPDCLTSLVFARHHTSDAQMRPLIVACLGFLAALAPKAEHVVIKPRSEQCFQIGQIASAAPDAHLVFMYRDAVSYVNSIQRMIQRVSGNPEFLTDPRMTKMGWYFASADAPATEKAEFLADGTTELTGIEVLTLAWLLRMRAMDEATQSGIPITPLHYADLNENRVGETARLFDAFGIDQAHLERGLEGFDQDAHHGSTTSNAIPATHLNAAQKAEVLATLGRWGSPNYEKERLGA